MVTANPPLGVALHSVGALFAASCYTPQKKTPLWAWEIYWISQATVAWLILPIIGALLTVPDYFGLLEECYSGLLEECPREVMLKSFGLGFLYGTGGLAFGLSIRYVGFSLTYSIAIGISATLGTLMPLFWTPNDGWVYKFDTLFESTPGGLIFCGIVLAVAGIFICGYAGALRELSDRQAQTAFSFRRGVPLTIIAGVLSSVFNFALLAGEPLAEAATERGAAEVLSGNAIYPFSHGGTWLINLFWCAFLIRKNRTAGQFVRLPKRTPGGMPFYYLMALLSGAFWYFQFFFYGMGHQNLGEKFGFTSWAIHMALLILFSNIYGKLFREWEGASRWPKRVVHFGMIVIVLATLIITWGNQLGAQMEAE
jgi:L-rhamnose-H+ transport protein